MINKHISWKGNYIILFQIIDGNMEWNIDKYNCSF